MCFLSFKNPFFAFFSFPRGSFGDCSFIAEILELKGTNCTFDENGFHSSLNVGIHRFSVCSNTVGKIISRNFLHVEQIQILTFSTSYLMLSPAAVFLSFYGTDGA